MIADALRRTRREVLRKFRADSVLDVARRVMGQVSDAEASMDRIAAVVASMLASVDGSRPFCWPVNGLPETGAAAELAGRAQDVRDHRAGARLDGIV